MNRRKFLQFSAATAFSMAGISDAQTAPSTRPSDAARVIELGSRGVRVHDPSSIVKFGDDYWVFYTGRGIPSWRSKDLKNWTAGPRAFDAPPSWAAQAVPANRGTYYWAPEIAHVGDRFLLYYAVSTFGKNVSAIGLASNPSLDPTDAVFKWADCGIVVQSAASDKFNAIDPSFLIDADNRAWLAFGSFWSGIKLIELNPATGQRTAPDSPIYSMAHAASIEAPCLYRRGKFYYLIVNWGLCCRGVNSTYNLRIGRSAKATGPYLDQSGKDMLQGGGTLLLGSDGPFIGPGQAGILDENGKTWISMHFYDRSKSGMSQLAIRALNWNVDGWPIVE